MAAEQVKVQEQQRVLGVIPNFYVTYEHNAAPLTPKLKFQLALKALTDPVTIGGFFRWGVEKPAVASNLKGSKSMRNVSGIGRCRDELSL